MGTTGEQARARVAAPGRRLYAAAYVLIAAISAPWLVDSEFRLAVRAFFVVAMVACLALAYRYVTAAITVGPDAVTARLLNGTQSWPTTRVLGFEARTTGSRRLPPFRPYELWVLLDDDELQTLPSFSWRSSADAAATVAHLNSGLRG